jgi:hypothetical protein
MTYLGVAPVFVPAVVLNSLRSVQYSATARLSVGLEMLWGVTDHLKKRLQQHLGYPGLGEAITSPVRAS